MAEAAKQEQGGTNDKVRLSGWIALFLFIMVFSGACKALGEQFNWPWLSIFDFNTLNGKFGQTLTGSGGFGARQGFMEGFVIFPTAMFALGILEVCEHYGISRAAETVFAPFLKIFLGIRGVCGMAFVASLNSTDVGAAMTRALSDEKQIEDDEKTIFVGFQFPGSATLVNTFGIAAPLLPITVISPIAIVGMILVGKFIAANLVRLAVHRNNTKNK